MNSPPLMVQLILANDPLRIARLERLFQATQKQIVDFYIRARDPEELSPLANGKGTDTERMEALRAYLSKIWAGNDLH